jgi:putative transcriptional regulator
VHDSREFYCVLGVQVRKGLFLGGGREVSQHVASGKAPAESVRWFFRYAGWAPGQLQQECARRVWFAVSCSTDLLTQEVEGAGEAMWHSVMDLIGEDFRKVSDEVRAEAKRR